MSSAQTSQRLLAMVALTNALRLLPGLETTCNEVMTHYCMLFPTVPNLNFIVPSLVDLAQYWQDIMRTSPRSGWGAVCEDSAWHVRKGRRCGGRLGTDVGCAAGAHTRATTAEINEAARALYSSTLVRLPAPQLASIVKYWMRFRTWPGRLRLASNGN